MSDLNLDFMRKSGSILSETLRFLEDSFVVPGVTALDISNKAREIINSYEDSTPAFLGYSGFPGTACVSVNHQVVHTIPLAEVVIKSGDIVSIDCGVIYKDHFSDACRTIAVGDIGIRARKLLKITKESLDKGIEAAIPGNRVGDISYAIQRHVERNRFQISLDYTGHGIGRVLHGPPQIPNYGPPGQGEVLVEGMCLAIEPVVFDGPTDVWIEEDHWTVYSKNGNLSAHFEDTIIVSAGGPEILTRTA